MARSVTDVAILLGVCSRRLVKCLDISFPAITRNFSNPNALDGA